MTLIPRIGDIFREGDPDGYHTNGTVADGEESDPIKIGPTGRGTTIGLVRIACGAGTGKVQWTMDDEDSIDEETADWYDWYQGEVTGSVYDTFKCVITAIKIVSVSGEISYKVVI